MRDLIFDVTLFDRHCEEAVRPTKQSQLIIVEIASPQKRGSQ
jgi:hypothetical protein